MLRNVLHLNEKRAIRSHHSRSTCWSSWL